MSIWVELKRRNVVRVSVAYIVMAWVVLQVVDFALDVIDAPNWILQLLVLLAAIGLPAVAAFAWVYEMTPEGLKRESEVDRSQSITGNTGKKLNAVIIGTLALAVAVLGYRQFMAPTPGPSPAAPAVTEAAQAIPKSIAVLPFEDFSENQDQDYFSKGISEEILNLLAKTDDLRVAARTSSFAFAGSEEDIRAIGEKLDVDTVLEGSIRKAGPTIRITAQLINVEDGYHLWSDSYDREFEDIFQIQDEIASAIMDSLRVHLLDEEEERIHSTVAADIDAYSAYLIGKERMALRTEEDLEAARAQFEKAIELDPGYAPARVQLAHVWLLLEQDRYGGEDVDRAEVDRMVTPHLERALAEAPDNPEAIAVKGLHDLRRNRNAEAKAAFDRALDLNPNYAQAYGWRAEIAFREKRFLDMLADKEKAYALDPMSLQLSADLATEYRNFWRPEDAQRIIDRMFDLHPDHPLAYRAASANLAFHGRYAEASLLLDRAIEAHPDDEWFEHFQGHGLLSLGLFEEAAESGDTDVLVEAAIMQSDYEKARELVESGLASGEDVSKWLAAARDFYQLGIGEGSQSRFQTVMDRSVEWWESRSFDWQAQCWPGLIYKFDLAGRKDDAAVMMDHCEEQMEERFKARYLCPCSLYAVVGYTILTGRLEEAMERADYWLSNGDSYYGLHVDPLFRKLQDQPGYADLLARNAAQVRRQRDIYLANRDDRISSLDP